MQVVLFLLVLFAASATGLRVGTPTAPVCISLSRAPHSFSVSLVSDTQHSYGRSCLLATSRNSNERTSRRNRLKRKLKNVWNSSKQWFKRRKGVTIYVLECEKNKYYVGCTTNMKRRLQEHLSKRGGSSWTRRFRPKRIVKEYRRVPYAYYLGKEAQVTAELMMQYGVNNVRGAMFTGCRPFTADDVSALTGFLGHFNNLDYRELTGELEIELGSIRPSSRRRKTKKRKRKAKASDRCFASFVEKKATLLLNALKGGAVRPNLTGVADKRDWFEL